MVDTNLVRGDAVHVSAELSVSPVPSVRTWKPPFWLSKRLRDRDSTNVKPQTTDWPASKHRNCRQFFGISAFPKTSLASPRGFSLDWAKTPGGWRVALSIGRGTCRTLSLLLVTDSVWG